MFGKCIFFLIVGFVILLSGCLSSLHQGKVMDGYSVSLAYRPIHFGATPKYLDFNKVFIAIRYGWAPKKNEDIGHSIGILADFKWSGFNKKSILPTIRFSGYLQLLRNSALDAGIGAEWPTFILYTAISMDLGTYSTIYSEVRWVYLSFASYEDLIVPTLGVKFNVSNHYSTFAELNRLYRRTGEEKPEKIEVSNFVGAGIQWMDKKQ